MCCDHSWNIVYIFSIAMATAITTGITSNAAIATGAIAIVADVAILAVGVVMVATQGFVGAGAGAGFLQGAQVSAIVA